MGKGPKLLCQWKEYSSKIFYKICGELIRICYNKDTIETEVLRCVQELN